MSPPSTDLPPPHSGEWWISTGDALDYADWLDPRIKAFGAWLAGPDAGQTPTPQAALVAQFVPWAARWATFYGGLQSSWWDRVDSWDTIEQYHQDLLGFEQLANANGMANVPDTAGTPSTLPGDVTHAFDRVSDKLSSTLTTLAVAGAVVGVVWFALDARSLKRAFRR